MHHIQRQLLVKKVPLTAFQTVNSITAYQDFLPHCSGSRILESGDNWLNAELTIVMKPMAVKLCTHNVWREGDYIEFSQLSGPFSTLTGRWTFEPHGDGHCNVGLDISFQLKPPLNLAVRSYLIKRITGQVATAFHEQINKAA